MKRLLSDLNKNIKEELAESETASPKRIEKAKERTATAYKDFRNYYNAERRLERRIEKFKDTDPALAQSFKDSLYDVLLKKDAANKIYKSAKNDYNKVAGIDYNITVNVHKFPASTNPENRKPLLISKKRLLRLANPAAYILKEQKRRFTYEIRETQKEIEALSLKIFNGITDEELNRIRYLEARQRGLKILLGKNSSALKTALLSQSAANTKIGKLDEEDLEEDYEEDLDEEEEESEDVGSASAPVFYTPLSGIIDIF